MLERKRGKNVKEPGERTLFLRTLFCCSSFQPKFLTISCLHLLFGLIMCTVISFPACFASEIDLTVIVKDTLSPNLMDTWCSYLASLSPPYDPAALFVSFKAPFSLVSLKSSSLSTLPALQSLLHLLCTLPFWNCIPLSICIFTVLFQDLSFSCFFFLYTLWVMLHISAALMTISVLMTPNLALELRFLPGIQVHVVN